MKTIWDIYYGDRFYCDCLRRSFTAEKKALEANPNWTKKQIKAHMEDVRECKIGITSNMTNRKNNLSYKENTHIHKSIKFAGTYAQALMVESYLRLAIEQAFPFQVTHQGNDHFRCNNVNVMKSIVRRFNNWVDEGIEFAKAERV